MGAPKGNRNGAHDKPWTRALQRYAQQNPDLLLRLAVKTFEQAMDGDASARAEIGNRLDGKPVQPVDVGGGLNITRTADELTDDALANIAAGGSAGVVAAASGPQSLN